jgi:hypothetical protein
MVSEKVEVLPAGRHLVLGYFSLVTSGEATPDVPAVLKVTSLNYTVQRTGTTIWAALYMRYMTSRLFRRVMSSGNGKPIFFGPFEVTDQVQINFILPCHVIYIYHPTILLQLLSNI